MEENKMLEKDFKQIVENIKSEIYKTQTLIMSDANKRLDILFRKKNESIDDPYITSNTLAALNYDKEDVKNELLKLKIFNYVETLVDIKDISGPRLYVFIKEIGKRDVYIKIKIREFKNKQVFCISFHFARFKNSKYPYKGVV